MNNQKLNETLHYAHSHNIIPACRTIYLNGSPSIEGEVPEIDYRCAVEFCKNMTILNTISKNPITVFLNLAGGSVCDGMAIYDTIRLSRSPVDIIVLSQCCSMGTVILQAARKRTLTKNCDFMVHYGTISCDETWMQAKSKMAYTQKSQETMFEIYAARCANGEFFLNHKYYTPKQYIEKKIKTKVDWYLTPEEAVYYGFADEVV